MLTHAISTLLLAQITQVTIHTQADLDAVRNNLDGDYVLHTHDVQLSGDWTPIGTTAAPFTGTFDGNGQAVTGLHAVGTGQVGLFGVTDGAVITDLTVVGHAEGAIEVGLVAGKTTATTLAGVHAEGTVVGYNEIPDGCLGRWVGGLVGHLDLGSIVRGCTVQAEVDASSRAGIAFGVIHSSYVRDTHVLGGAVYGGPGSLPCFDEGEVYRTRVGGFAGYITSYNEAEFPEYTGDTWVINCSVLAEDVHNSGVYQGGFVGWVGPDTVVMGCTSQVDEVRGTLYRTGGFMGQAIGRQDITGPFGEFPLISQCSAQGSVWAQYAWLGGFAGSMHLANVERCWADTVVSTGVATQMGGFSGGVDWLSQVSDCYALGTVGLDLGGEGTFATGGFCSNLNSNADMTRCYAATEIIVEPGDQILGGLVGYITSSISHVTDSYWDVDITGMDDCTDPEGSWAPENCGAVGLSTVDMYAADWPAFDWENVWMHTAEYPVLRAYCDYELSGDRTVGISDMLAMLGSWGLPYDGVDLVNLLLSWGDCL